MPWTLSATGLDRERRRSPARVLVGLLLLSLATLGSTPQAAEAGSKNQTAPAASTSRRSSLARQRLPGVTIQASKEQKALRRTVDHFVTAVVAQPRDSALYRWTKPICPLVAGLPKAVGEFILERVSKAALDAKAPLAGRVCHANLYVVATDDPDQLLKMWWARDREMYNTTRSGAPGMPPIIRFINSRRPIRVWYNTHVSCDGKGPGARGISPAAVAILPPGAALNFPPPVCSAGIDTHLSRASTWSNISWAIVVIDLRRMKNVTVQQLADYVALIGLADVRLDADPGTTPSILELFGHEAPPPGLTLWDRALLYSLYNTSQSDMLQMPALEITMVRRIGP